MICLFHPKKKEHFIPVPPISFSSLLCYSKVHPRPFSAGGAGSTTLVRASSNTACTRRINKQISDPFFFLFSLALSPWRVRALHSMYLRALICRALALPCSGVMGSLLSFAKSYTTKKNTTSLSKEGKKVSGFGFWLVQTLRVFSSSRKSI